MKKNRWRFLVLFPISAFIILALIRLKVYPLQFWVDELYHVIAAIGILTTGQPILPSGLLYERSIITTLLTAGSFKLLVNKCPYVYPFAIALLDIFICQIHTLKRTEKSYETPHGRFR